MKKILTLFLVCLFAFNIVACSFSIFDDKQKSDNTQEQGKTDSLDPVDGNKTVTLLIPFPEDKPGKYALDRIGIALDELVFTNTGLHIRIATVKEQTHELEDFTNAFEKEGVDLAILKTWNAKALFTNHIVKDIKEELLNSGNVLLSAYPDRRIGSALSVKGQIYALPSTTGIMQRKVALMDTQILERNQIDSSSIKTIEDLNDVFQEISSYESDIYMIADDALLGPGFFDYESIDTESHYGIIPFSGSDSQNLVCLYETDEYMNWCKWKNEWFLRGWNAPEISESEEPFFQLMQEGKALCCFTEINDPGDVSYYEQLFGGRELTMVPLGEPVISTESVVFSEWCYAIPEEADNPADSLRVLEFLMISREAEELLAYGQENIDYIRTDSGTLTFPEGKDGMSVGYHPEINMRLPNPGLLTPWDNEEQRIKEEREIWQEKAVHSPYLGFSFDSSPIRTQLDFCNETLWQYLSDLRNGKIDPETYIPQLVEELKESGLNEIYEEMERQMKNWEPID